MQTKKLSYDFKLPLLFQAQSSKNATKSSVSAMLWKLVQVR